MSNAILKGNASGTGSVTLESPNTNSDRTIALPDSNGTVMVSGNMPAFSAYQSSSQTLTSNISTKIQFQTEEFDTNSNYDTSTYRFTPTVAGYYYVSAGISANVSATSLNCFLFKNGSSFKRLYNSSGNSYMGSGSCLVHLNGSTDYIEIYGLFGTGQAIYADASGTWFQATMVRGV